MKYPIHATTNFRRVAPFLAAANANDGHIRLEHDPYMPLVVENLDTTDEHGFPIYSITHYGEMNGDAMADPDMEFSVDYERGAVIPRTFQNDYMGIYHEVFYEDGGKQMFRPQLLIDLDGFLSQWLQNIERQGFNPFPDAPKTKKPKQPKKPDPYPADQFKKFEVGRTYRVENTDGTVRRFTVRGRTQQTVQFEEADCENPLTVRARIDGELTRFLEAETVTVYGITFCPFSPED